MAKTEKEEEKEKAAMKLAAVNRLAATRKAYLTKPPGVGELANTNLIDAQYARDNAPQRYDDNHLNVKSSSIFGKPIARLINNIGGRKKLITGYEADILAEQQALRKSVLAGKNRDEIQDAAVNNLGNERSLNKTLNARNYEAELLTQQRNHEAELLAAKNVRDDRGSAKPVMVYNQESGDSKMVRFQPNGNIIDVNNESVTLDPNIYTTSRPRVTRRPTSSQIKNGRQARNLLQMLEKQKEDILAFNTGADEILDTEDDNLLNRPLRDTSINILNSFSGTSGLGAIAEERVNNTPADRTRRLLKSNAAQISAELKHEIYGSAFTKGEGQLSKEWAFDAPGISDVTMLDRVQNAINKTKVTIDQDFGGVDFENFDYFAPQQYEDDEESLEDVILRNLGGQ